MTPYPPKHKRISLEISTDELGFIITGMLERRLYVASVDRKERTTSSKTELQAIKSRIDELEQLFFDITGPIHENKQI